MTKHPEFKGELIEEFVARREHFERCARGLPSIFDKFKLLKESVHRTAAFIRRKCQGQIAETTEHKLAVCMSFLRAIHARDYQRARSLQAKC